MEHPHVEVRADLCDGSPVIRGTFFPVRTLWRWHNRGASVESLVRSCEFSPAQIYDALSFAYDNVAVIEADLDRTWRAPIQDLLERRRPG